MRTSTARLSARAGDEQTRQCVGSSRRTGQPRLPSVSTAVAPTTGRRQASRGRCERLIMLGRRSSRAQLRRVGRVGVRRRGGAGGSGRGRAGLVSRLPTPGQSEPGDAGGGGRQARRGLDGLGLPDGPGRRRSLSPLARQVPETPAPGSGPSAELELRSRLAVAGHDAASRLVTRGREVLHGQLAARPLSHAGRILRQAPGDDDGAGLL